MAINDFPDLVIGVNCSITSPSADYNCIAWAAGDTHNWWWPDELDSYWPSGVVREETLDAFFAAYATLNYERCDDGSLESGVEKIAIYSSSDGPQHVARQLPNGHWTSKLGPDEDIEHHLVENVMCDLYGFTVCYMKRARG
jgi:hypothetical protein